MQFTGGKKVNIDQELEIYEQMGWNTEELLSRDENKFVEYENLSIEAQQAVNLFYILPDKLDGAAIGWYGKDFSELKFFMEMTDIYDYKKVFNLLLVCVGEYSNYTHKEREKEDRKTRR